MVSALALIAAPLAGAFLLGLIRSAEKLAGWMQGLQ